jgi:hypothetical protein
MWFTRLYGTVLYSSSGDGDDSDIAEYVGALFWDDVSSSPKIAVFLPGNGLWQQQQQRWDPLECCWSVAVMREVIRAPWQQPVVSDHAGLIGIICSIGFYVNCIVLYTVYCIFLFHLTPQTNTYHFTMFQCISCLCQSPCRAFMCIPYHSVSERWDLGSSIR